MPYTATDLRNQNMPLLRRTQRRIDERATKLSVNGDNNENLIKSFKSKGSIELIESKSSPTRLNLYSKRNTRSLK
jgi:hypothetical protein